jgi:hypothetical protein
VKNVGKGLAVNQLPSVAEESKAGLVPAISEEFVVTIHANGKIRVVTNLHLKVHCWAKLMGNQFIGAITTLCPF